MLSGDGSGNSYVKDSGGNVVIGTNGQDKLTVSKNGDVSLTSDISAPGGLVQQLVYRSEPFQGKIQNMSASIAHLAEGLTRHQVIRNGSVVGLGLYSQLATISAGALTASITINGVQQSGLQLILTAGSGSVGTVAKDTIVFRPGEGLGIVLTSSADFATSVAVTSGTFIGSLLIEQ